MSITPPREKTNDGEEALAGSDSEPDSDHELAVDEDVDIGPGLLDEDVEMDVYGSGEGEDVELMSDFELDGEEDGEDA